MRGQSTNCYISISMWSPIVATIYMYVHFRPARSQLSLNLSPTNRKKAAALANSALCNISCAASFDRRCGGTNFYYPRAEREAKKSPHDKFAYRKIIIPGSSRRRRRRRHKRVAQALSLSLSAHMLITVASRELYYTIVL